WRSRRGRRGPGSSLRLVTRPCASRRAAGHEEPLRVWARDRGAPPSARGAGRAGGRLPRPRGWNSARLSVLAPHPPKLHEGELAAPRGRVELAVVERRQRERQVPRDDGLPSHHLRRRTAPVGSVFAPATKASSQPSTGDVDVPRICRTASFRLLRPWMKASESCPPFVLQTSRPCGQARPPFSTNGPPSPRRQKP